MRDETIEYECPGCDIALTETASNSGQRISCPGCGNVNIVPASEQATELTPAQLIGNYMTDIRNKILLLAIAVLLITAGAPAALTRLFGQPSAGLEDIFTIWNIAWLTFPMTLGVGAASTIYLVSDEKKRHSNEVRYWMVGIVVAAAFIGGHLGQFQFSKASQKLIDSTESITSDVAEKLSDNELMSRGVAKMGVQIGEHIKPKGRIALIFAIGAFVFVAFNYFTLYGPAAFFSSVLVGIFSGWVCGIKIPSLWAELNSGKD